MKKEEVDLLESKKKFIDLILGMSKEDYLWSVGVLSQKRRVITDFQDLLQLFKMERPMPEDIDVILKGEVLDMFINRKNDAIVRKMY